MVIGTQISSTRKFKKQMLKVPKHIQKKIIFWVFQVETQGIAEVMKFAGFHDEPLKGSRWGQRSVRMNRSYRIIYRVISDRIKIELLEVHNHDY